MPPDLPAVYRNCPEGWIVSVSTLVLPESPPGVPGPQGVPARIANVEKHARA